MTFRLASNSATAELRRALGPSAWCALECLVERSTDGRSASASVRAVAADLGVAKNTAHRAIVTLVRAGVAEIVRERSDAGRFVDGHYRLHLDDNIERITVARVRTVRRPRTRDDEQLSLLA